MGRHLIACLCLWSSWPCFASSTTDSFQVMAAITSGCAFGSNSSASADFGTLDFGTMSAISTPVDVSSSSGAGSIVVTCTPGTAITLALDYGEHGGSASSRYLSNGSATLAYQLYQDAAHTTVWGSDALAYSVSSFPDSTQTYTIYGRLFATSGLPASGTYSDTVTVTLTY
ncbi:spore coat U domain-containing protein [Pantoea vagans]|uniref:Spore coat protein U n=3 Tax=Pantoea TaxID=53335 RepID=A0A0U3T6I9_9GAMM|nr:spore coat U domain-containing protein [Pantoea vagans]ALV93412.1 spore coat protein U [Pantoea vagans]KHJ67879.1 spore coat protein U [Pantoea rodasii]